MVPQRHITLGLLALPAVLVPVVVFVAIVPTGRATGLFGLGLCGAIAFDVLLREEPIGSNRHEDVEFVVAMVLVMVLLYL